MGYNDSAILVVATRNPGKAREFRQLLSSLPFRVLSLDDVGVDIEVEETGDTFNANAELKVRAYQMASGELTIADDSGIEVAALGGAPGVYSARFLREGQTDEEGRDYLLEKMAGVPEGHRQARYRATITILGRQTGGEVHFFEGACEGTITQYPIGNGGFGYDPIFWLPKERKTMAELSPPEKDSISHRGIAVRSALGFLKTIT